MIFRRRFTGWMNVLPLSCHFCSLDGSVESFWSLYLHPNGHYISVQSVIRANVTYLVASNFRARRQKCGRPFELAEAGFLRPPTEIHLYDSPGSHPMRTSWRHFSYGYPAGRVREFLFSSSIATSTRTYIVPAGMIYDSVPNYNDRLYVNI